MKRYINSATQKKLQHFIVWFNDELGDEQYIIIPAVNINEAKDKASDMFGEDVTEVKFYNP